MTNLTETFGPFPTAELVWTNARTAEDNGLQTGNFRQDEFGFWFDAGR